MKLRDLDGHFLRYNPEDGSYDLVDDIREADGVSFQCPKCAVGKEKGEDPDTGRRFVRGAHYVICWFVGRVPDDLSPAPGRWKPEGTGLDDLTFVGPGAASVFLQGGCGWHGFVRNGSAE